MPRAPGSSAFLSALATVQVGCRTSRDSAYLDSAYLDSAYLDSAYLDSAYLGSEYRAPMTGEITVCPGRRAR
jgi:hypothetical protein